MASAEAHLRPAPPGGRLVRTAAPSPIWTWEAAGPPGAPAVLLLHGWMATAALNWYGALSYLGERFHVVAPNLRGHGRGGRECPPFSLEACSDDLASLVQTLGLRGMVVVGYSMGGAVAQVLARRHADVLGGVVLCATAATFARRIQLRPLVRVAGRAASNAARGWPEGAEVFLRWRLARHDRAVAARRARSGTGAEAPAEDWVLEERRLSHLAAFIESGAELNAYDSRPWLPDLAAVPAAAVVTLRDRVVAPWRQEAMAARWPGCRRYEVDAGHDAVVAHPELLLPVLARACAELAKGGRTTSPPSSR